MYSEVYILLIFAGTLLKGFGVPLIVVVFVLVAVDVVLVMPLLLLLLLRMMLLMMMMMTMIILHIATNKVTITLRIFRGDWE